MQTMTGRFLAGAALAASLLLGGCGGKAAPGVTDGWVRLAANPAAPAAAYFTLKGGGSDAVLTGLSTALVKKIELHENRPMAHGMTGMAPLAQVAVPAGATVAFAPGGRHAMLFGVDPSVRAGDRMTTAFQFAGQPIVIAPLKVVGPGDPAPF
jgi:hypothetical protein